MPLIVFAVAEKGMQAWREHKEYRPAVMGEDRNSYQISRRFPCMASYHGRRGAGREVGVGAKASVAALLLISGVLTMTGPAAAQKYICNGTFASVQGGWSCDGVTTSGGKTLCDGLYIMNGGGGSCYPQVASGPRGVEDALTCAFATDGGTRTCEGLELHGLPSPRVDFLPACPTDGLEARGLGCFNVDGDTIWVMPKSPRQIRIPLFPGQA